MGTNPEENQQPPSPEKEYTKMDLLAAFKHGRAYEPLDTAFGLIDPAMEGEIDYDKELEIHRPFWEWLRIKKLKTP